jgi:hypothetical protein
MRRACSAIEPAVFTLKLGKLDKLGKQVKLEWFVQQTSDQSYQTTA